MGRSGAALAAVMTLLSLTACSTPAPPPTPTPPTTTAAATKPSTTQPSTTKPAAPPFTPPASPAKITAACPFLGVGELQRVIETSEDFSAAEQPPDPAFVPHTEFQCTYAGQTGSPWELDLWIIAAGRSFRPAQ